MPDFGDAKEVDAVALQKRDVKNLTALGDYQGTMSEGPNGHVLPYNFRPSANASTPGAVCQAQPSDIACSLGPTPANPHLSSTRSMKRFSPPTRVSFESNEGNGAVAKIHGLQNGPDFPRKMFLQSTSSQSLYKVLFDISRINIIGRIILA